MSPAVDPDLPTALAGPLPAAADEAPAPSGRPRWPVVLGLLALAGALSGCDMLGIDTPEKKQADGKAIGAACRHAGRAIEDCYMLNAKGDKAAIYAGWREMDDYMRENKLEPVVPVVKPEDLLPKPKPKPEPKKKPKPPSDEEGGEADPEAKSGDKASDKSAEDAGERTRSKPTH